MHHEGRNHIGQEYISSENSNLMSRSDVNMLELYIVGGYHASWTLFLLMYSWHVMTLYGNP